MARKTFAVLGLGKFGGAVARELSEMDCDVIAVDLDEDLVKDISHEVSYALVADVTDSDVMKEIGIGDTDAVFLSIAEDMESSILAAIISKELGAKQIIAKASSKMHGKVLEKVGVDRVIYPEKEMGIRIAKNVVAGNFLDMIDLSSKYSLVEFRVPKEWVGKTLIDLDVRRKHQVNVIAMKRNDDIVINISPNDEFLEDDVLIIVGSNKAIAELGD